MLPNSTNKELRDPVKEMGTSATLNINIKVKKLLQEGADIVNFGLGESPFGAPSTVQEELKKHGDKTSYYPSEGIFELREKIRDFYKFHYNIDIHEKQIIVGPGSKQIIFQTMLALKSSWIFISPSWVSYETQAKLIDRPFYRIYAKEENGYMVTLDDIKTEYENSIIDTEFNQLIILINYPNNPTGMSLNKTEVRKIADFAREKNILILSDEIYANVTHGEKTHHSFYVEYPEGTIVTGGISKDRSMGGYRLGVGILPNNDNLINAYKAISSETYSSVAAPIQHAAITSFEINENISEHIDHSTYLHSLVGNYVYMRLKNCGYIVKEPQGAFYCFPSLERYKSQLNAKGIFNSKDLEKLLLEEYGVAVLGGYAFAMPNEKLVFRMAYIDYDGRKVLSEYRKLRDENSKKIEIENFIEKNCPRIVEGMNRLELFLKEKIS